MLVLLLAVSDEEARLKYEVLYARYGKVLYGIAKSILRDEHLAHDALQECFLKVFLNLDRIDQIESPQTKTYLMTIAKRTSIDFYRKEKTRRDVTEPADVLSYNIEDDFHVEEIFAHAELSKNLLHHISQLDELDKNIILFKYFYYCPDNQIAELTGITPGNVRIRLMRAKQKLAKFIVEKEGGDFNDFIW